MLADPDRRLRSRALLMLLDNPLPKVEKAVRKAVKDILAPLRKAVGVGAGSSAGRAASAATAAEAAASRAAIEDASRRNDDLDDDLEGGGGRGGGDSGESSGGLVIPMPDPDPLNATFLVEDTKYSSWVEEYGLDSADLLAGGEGGGGEAERRSPASSGGPRSVEETASDAKSSERGVSDAELNAMVRPCLPHSICSQQTPSSNNATAPSDPLANAAHVP